MGLDHREGHNATPIRWQSLTRWVAGKTLRSSDGLDWGGVGLRSFEFQKQRAEVPALRDYTLVSYDADLSPMRRSLDGRWKEAVLERGATSLLTRKQESIWDWDETAYVTHIYLSQELMEGVAEEILDGQGDNIDLPDVLHAKDSVIRKIVVAFSREAACGGLGGPLYAEALSRDLIIHLLRSYAAVSSPWKRPDGDLSISMRRHILEYIQEHLAFQISLEEMAAQVGLPPWAFARRFKTAFGQPPYAFVLSCRVEQAKRLLISTSLPLSEIAAMCGFSDQAHLTRIFHRTFGMPPGKYRRHVLS
jgi:AraC family transcriptional regulator